MHFSSNISHWVCIFMGVFLIVIGLVSHEPRRVSTSVTVPVEQAETYLGMGKRAVLICIGLLAAAYGISRVLA